jgi:PHD/YefM family antitoxin component YafN of YafNO toxin-antitoxin module
MTELCLSVGEELSSSFEPRLKKVIKKNNLSVQIVQTSAGEKLVYDPADKWVLLKLLDDDYLWSLMTEHSYEVTGKREIE